MLTLYAPQISTYGRIVAMVAFEAGLDWQHVPTDSKSKENRQRHPFGKTPSVDIDGQHIYESVAICQYIDDVHNDGALQPKDPFARARMSQWLAIANQYLFPSTEHGLVMPLLLVPLGGGLPRHDIVEQALPTIAYQMAIVSTRLEEAPYLAGEDISLADLFMWVIIKAAKMTDEGNAIVSQLLPLLRWFERIEKRESVSRTAWPI